MAALRIAAALASSALASASPGGGTQDLSVRLGRDGAPDNLDVRALSEIAAQISAAERRAMKAERETADRLIAHFLADRVGATFSGHISGVTRAGLFVKLDQTGADGFIPARSLGEEYFRYEETAHAMVAARSGETHRLGDPVTVRLVEAAPVAGALRFELLSEARHITRPRFTPSERKTERRRGSDRLRRGKYRS